MLHPIALSTALAFQVLASTETAPPAASTAAAVSPVPVSSATALAPALPPQPRCPDGTEPKLTGHPIHPFFCPGLHPAEPAPAKPAGAEAGGGSPSLKDRQRTGFGPLVGRWEGMVQYGIGLYEVFCEIAKGSGRSYRVSLQTAEYRTHETYRYDAVLTDSFWHPGRFEGPVTLRELPGRRLDALLLLGAAPAQGKAPPELDRRADLSYQGRSDLHRVSFAVTGKDTLRFRYAYGDGDPAHGFVEASGDLGRSKRQGL